jgi:hypothetical protein
MALFITIGNSDGRIVTVSSFVIESHEKTVFMNILDSTTARGIVYNQTKFNFLIYSITYLSI